MPQHLRDALEKWKSSDKSTNAAELTHCSSNAEASGPGLINSSFWLRRKKKAGCSSTFAEEGTTFFRYI